MIFANKLTTWCMADVNDQTQQHMASIRMSARNAHMVHTHSLIKTTAYVQVWRNQLEQKRKREKKREHMFKYEEISMIKTTAHVQVWMKRSNLIKTTAHVQVWMKRSNLIKPTAHVQVWMKRSNFFLSFFKLMQWSMRMRMITDDAMEVHFGLRLLDRAADHAYCHNYPGVNQTRELRHLQCWSSN